MLVVRPDLLKWAGASGSALAAVPLWMSLPATFFAVFGIVSFVQKLNTSRLQTRADVNANCLEVDLRSTGPVVLMRGMANPQFSVWFRLTNHASYPLRVTHFTADVWFGQPTLKLMLDRPFNIEPHSTKDSIGLTDIPDRSKVDYIESFLGSEDFAKTLYLDVSVACESEEGHFEKFVHIERRSPELSTILR